MYTELTKIYFKSKVQYIFRLHNVPIPTIFTLKTSLTYYQHVMHFSRWNSFIKTWIRIKYKFTHKHVCENRSDFVEEAVIQ